MSPIATLVPSRREACDPLFLIKIKLKVGARMSLFGQTGEDWVLAPGARIVIYLSASQNYSMARSDLAEGCKQLLRILFPHPSSHLPSLDKGLFIIE